MSFQLLRDQLRRSCFHVSPFLVLGDPQPDASVELARAAVREGATMLEIGFPYSDPIADGPAIQAADLRALRGGTSTDDAIRILSRIRAVCADTPLNLLVYGNLVHRRGYERFCREATDSGASSLLVPDIPVEESAALRRASRKAGLAHVELVGPRTAAERLRRLDGVSDGFLYLVAHQGVTGVRDGSFEAVAELVRRTHAVVRNPICLGFGLSRAEHVREAFRAGARIAVVGSHLARVIGDAWTEAPPRREERVVERFVEAFRPLVSARESVVPVRTPVRVRRKTRC